MVGGESKIGRFSDEKQIQDWLQSIVALDALTDVIEGRESVEDALRGSGSSEFWPHFPVDYLTRIGNLQAAQKVLDSLHELDFVSKNTRSISFERGEKLFVDLLYCARAESRFVLFEIKNRIASTREAITELFAYEHETLNHIPFSSTNDILMVVVSRDFPTLLDHAITGLNTWSRKRILCLRFDDSEEIPSLTIHVPKAWSAIGQTGLAEAGLVTAALSFEPLDGLTEDQVRAICSTAAALIVREAERYGGSGFAILTHNHLYPKTAEGPYLILVGVVNPFSFLRQAQSSGFLENSRSPILDYVLSEDRASELSISWNWTSCDGGAAVDYLRGFGRPTWEAFSNWQHLRDVRRWQQPSITMDRHLTPVSVDFWGGLGDFARDIIRRVERLRNFIPGFAKPGFDWRHPLLGVGLIDEIALKKPVPDGQWVFSAVFSLGIRLGRLCALSGEFADVDPETQRKLRAAVFWAEVDALSMLHEVGIRYLAAKEIIEPPPPIPIGRYESGEQVFAAFSDFAQWFIGSFIADDLDLMQEAFVTGITVYSVFDLQFDPFGDNPEVAKLRDEATLRARNWLKLSVAVAIGDDRDASAAASSIKHHFGDRVPLISGEEKAFVEIDAMSSELLIEKLLLDIPKIVDTWHPQLAHTLAPLTEVEQDWDWYEDQIRAAHARGQVNPCVYLSADGQMGIGQISEKHPVPKVGDPEKEVLFVDNESGFEVMAVVAWTDLRAGNVPGLRSQRISSSLDDGTIDENL